MHNNQTLLILQIYTMHKVLESTKIETQVESTKTEAYFNQTYLSPTDCWAYVIPHFGYYCISISLL